MISGSENEGQMRKGTLNCLVKKKMCKSISTQNCWKHTCMRCGLFHLCKLGAIKERPPPLPPSPLVKHILNTGPRMCPSALWKLPFIYSVQFVNDGPFWLNHPIPFHQSCLSGLSLWVQWLPTPFPGRKLQTHCSTRFPRKTLPSTSSQMKVMGCQERGKSHLKMGAGDSSIILESHLIWR